MERKCKLGTAVALFLALTLFAAAYIWKNGNDNSFEINRDNGPTENVVDSEAAKGEERGDVSIAKEEEEIKSEEKDYSPLIEKYKGKEIIRIKTDRKAVALTFDAGANADGVDKVLPILAENNIKATFFLTGKFIERYPQKVREIVATGGDLGNPSYDHPYFTRLTNEGIKTEIQGAENALAKLDGKFKPFLRSPYGDRNAGTLLAISGNDYLNIRWTVDSLGWKGTSGGMSKAAIEQKVLKASSPGAIIMMHLGSNPDDKTHLDSEALPEIISKLREDGYEFMTLSKILELEN
jgi:peptidoglycan/xylan/chitin deacetylase (PgdA/CDA1 family)